MKAARVLLVVFAVLVAQSAFAGFEGYANLSHSDTHLTSAMSVSYIFDSVICPECSYQMIGDHWIKDTHGGTIVGQQWGVYGSEYRNVLTGWCTGLVLRWDGLCVDNVVWLQRCASAWRAVDIRSRWTLG